MPSKKINSIARKEHLKRLDKQIENVKRLLENDGIAFRGSLALRLRQLHEEREKVEKGEQPPTSNKLNDLRRVAVGSVLVGFALWSCHSMSNYKSSDSDEDLRRFNCEQELKQMLKDPNSYQRIDIVDMDNGPVIIKYRAKNSFGGYNIESYTCF